MAIKTRALLINTANTNRDGTGVGDILVTGAASGTIIDEITINATNTTTAGMIRLYIDEITPTAANRLHSQIPVSAVTPTATTASWSTVIRPLNLKLGSGQKLLVSTQNAESFHVTASVTDL